MARPPKNIRKRGKNGNYYLRFQQNGKETWKSLRTDNLQEAKRLAPLVRDRIETSEPRAKELVTVMSFYEEWVTEYVPQECSSARAYNIQTWMGKHILPGMGNLLLTGVDVRALRRLRASLDNKGLATSTVASILSIFRAMLTYAVTVDEIPRNPFRGSRIMPEEDDLAPRRLDDDTVESILDACPEEHRLTVELALATGLRWSEVMRLTWSHVVWEPKPKLLVEGTKGRRKARKRRQVPLDPEITAKLRVARLRATDLMVITERPWKSWVIRKQILKETGIAFRFHDLRHTFAARYVEAGGSLAMLQEILGHSSLAMVMRYAKPTDRAVQEDAERVFRSRSRSKSRSNQVGEFGSTP